MTFRSVRTAKVAVIGYGAIGRVLCTSIRDAAEHSGGRFGLFGVVSRSGLPVGAPPRITLEQAVKHCDVVVEAAGHQVVAEHGEYILNHGADLLVVSVGATADPEVHERLLKAGPGRVFFAAGAVGGLGLLSAAQELTPLDSVRLTTTKKSKTLIQPWMTPAMTDRLNNEEALIVFEGTAREAAQRFPKSTNVAASIAMALDGWDSIQVVVKADPSVPRTSHLIEASSGAGRYRFDIHNEPDPANPATSAVVAHNVARSVNVLMRCGGQVI